MKLLMKLIFGYKNHFKQNLNIKQKQLFYYIYIYYSLKFQLKPWKNYNILKLPQYLKNDYINI